MFPHTPILCLLAVSEVAMASHTVAMARHGYVLAMATARGSAFCALLEQCRVMGK